MRATKVHEITRAFLETHPEEAARVLEHVAPPNCAALLNAVPLKLATEVLRHMLATHAARCLEHLNPVAAIGLVRALPPQTSAALLRYVPLDTREAILAELPAGAALSLKLLLTYPEDTVGAWTDMRVPALAPDATVKETIERVRRTRNESAGYVYVVTSDHRLRGVVPLLDIVRAVTKTRLEELMVAAEMVSARASLAAAKAHDGWRDFYSLAVVDHDQRFVGALHHAALERALAGRAGIEPLAQVTETFAGLVNAYWLGFSGLLRAAVPLLTGRHRGAP